MTEQELDDIRARWVNIGVFDVPPCSASESDAMRLLKYVDELRAEVKRLDRMSEYFAGSALHWMKAYISAVYSQATTTG